MHESKKGLSSNFVRNYKVIFEVDLDTLEECKKAVKETYFFKKILYLIIGMYEL